MVSTTLVINLSPVSTTPPIKENPRQRLIAGVNDTPDKFVSGVIDTAKQFIAGVVDTADKHSFAIISANFKNGQNDPNEILRGPEYTDT